MNLKKFSTLRVNLLVIAAHLLKSFLNLWELIIVDLVNLAITNSITVHNNSLW